MKYHYSTKSSHWSLFRAKLLVIHSVIIPLALGLSDTVLYNFRMDFPIQVLMLYNQMATSMYLSAPCVPHNPLVPQFSYNHPNDIWRRVAMKLTVM